MVCRQCRNPLELRDWTCPRCGAIIERYLFSTIELKNLEGTRRRGFEAGYEQCERQVRAGGPPAIQPEQYRPIAGVESEYRAGWQKAAEKINAKLDRRFGRRRGMIVLGSGVLALAVGAAVAILSKEITSGYYTLLLETPLALGAVNTIIGMAMMITGDNDEARPDA